MNKAEYRLYFASVKDYVKMTWFLKRAKIDDGNFSRFLQDHHYDYLISINKLKDLYDDMSWFIIT